MRRIFSCSALEPPAASPTADRIATLRRRVLLRRLERRGNQGGVPRAARSTAGSQAESKAHQDREAPHSSHLDKIGGVEG